MSYTVVDYLVTTNEDWLDGFVIEDGDGPVDLTGSSFIAHIRTEQDALLVILVASTDNGRLVIAEGQSDPESETVGNLSWNIPESALKLIEPGEYVYDVLWIDADERRDTIMGGKIEIQRGITRP